MKRIKLNHIFSMKIPLFLLFLIIGFLPVFIQSKFMNQSFSQTQIDGRMIEVQNQCLITGDRLTRAGYLLKETHDPLIDKELDTIADIFNGRIVVVDQNFRIVKDTFGLADGRINVSEPIVKCFRGENVAFHEADKHYVVTTAQICDSEDEKNVIGVLLMTVSTENIVSNVSKVAEKMSFYGLMIIGVLILCSILFVVVLMKPFGRLQEMLNKVADGNLDESISENTYKETWNISQAVQSTITKLRTVDQSREEFVSNVSHELKTPITSIRVLADSLMSMEEVPVELYREFMTDISDEIDRESKIIDDLLSLVKMDKAAAELNIAQVDINALVQQILKRLRPIAKKRNVELIYESIREVTADVDEVKLSLAINNLVENAVKYNIENGWVRVTLDADHKFFYIKVADSGIGIPEEYQEHIFERFYRVDKARSRETGGTGLGLSITRNVILMHHGAIRLSSKEGEGSTFTVRIPLNYISRRSRMKKYVYRLLLLLTVLALAGCGEKKTEAVAGEAYKIYYLNTSVTKLAPYEYHTETTDTELLIQELMEQFLKVPNDVDSQAALSDKVGYRGYRLEERILYLYFDGGYSRVNMDATREILCRAALTKTMTQLEGVDYISIYVADQPLLDLTGKPVGLLADTDFIESISDVNTFEKIQITLYFADETGEKLVEEDREVVHSMNTSLEKLVVEELLKGPEVEGGYPTLPSDVKLLNVSVSENVCYVNFDSNFLNNSLEVKELIPIYSIVNSLCAISNVNKVQLTVNGSSDVMFRDVISLNTQFERNLDLGGE